MVQLFQPLHHLAVQSVVYFQNNIIIISIRSIYHDTLYMLFLLFFISKNKHYETRHQCAKMRHDRYCDRSYLMRLLITISEIRLGSIPFLCFHSRRMQYKCRRVQCIHAYLHILFYKGKRLRDYNIDLLQSWTYTSKSIFSLYPKLQPMKALLYNREIAVYNNQFLLATSGM